jgi:hypothetical protein
MGVRNKEGGGGWVRGLHLRRHWPSHTAPWLPTPMVLRKASEHKGYCFKNDCCQ